MNKEESSSSPSLGLNYKFTLLKSKSLTGTRKGIENQNEFTLNQLIQPEIEICNDGHQLINFYIQNSNYILQKLNLKKQEIIKNELKLNEPIEFIILQSCHKLKIGCGDGIKSFLILIYQLFIQLNELKLNYSSMNIDFIIDQLKQTL
jgi:chaperonin GroEL (HSP60 family)